MAISETTSGGNGVRVFISYSHKDEKPWKDLVVTHLKPLVHQGDLVLWDDRKIGTGADWYSRITDELAKADIAICLISADYLASDFINKEEIPAMKRRRKEEGMLLLPLLLSPCPWKAVNWLKGIQMFPRDGVSLEEIKSMVRRKKALADFVVEISGRVVVDDFVTPAPAPEFSPPEKVDITRLPETGVQLFGREKELQLLDEMWDSGSANVVSLVAWGGVGKSTLVNQWLEYLKTENYRSARRVYGWSFYSQGTGQRVTSADQFISEALQWFGDADPKRGSPWDKGERLADLVRRKKTLLVLDGLEPLQSGFEFDKGKITDPALSVLLTQLARHNNGLCVVTTRERIADMKDYPKSTLPVDLEQISKQAGRALLRIGGVQGTDEELEAASEAFGNHALAVSLLATYLHGIEGHHVSHAASIGDLDIPDAKGRHPRRVIEAFHERFGDSPQTQVLRIMGLFDRPADLAAIDAVKVSPPIAGLTDRLVDLPERQWQETLDSLRACRLLAPRSEHNPNVLDCHPLIREHFADVLRTHFADAWQAGHRRLYEHLCATTTDKKPAPTLQDLQPLYQAVAHGCLAGMQQEACDKIYYDRITRGMEKYVVRKLGAFGSDLAAVACFFERPWSTVSDRLAEADQAWLLNEAAFRLRALGRLTEALEPMRATLEINKDKRRWRNAAIVARNLSELELARGQTTAAVADAEDGVEYADLSEEPAERRDNPTTLADALFQAGRVEEAREQFRQAESMQAERQPQYPLLYSLRGFQYCDLLLAPAERFAWQALLNPQSAIRNPQSADACDAVEKRAEQSLTWEKGMPGAPILDFALHYLTLARAALYEALLTDGPRATCHESLTAAVDGLRQSGSMDDVPRGLLTRAMFRFVEAGGASASGEELAGCRSDLDEAWQIAERGSMKLFLADVHLHRARLFRDKAALAEAEKLINECGYHRRDGELEDAKAALGVAAKSTNGL